MDKPGLAWQPARVRRSSRIDVLSEVSQLLGEPAVGQELIQELWSGYGQIVRVRLASGRTVVVKAVRPPQKVLSHPRGHATDRSHQRKLRSFDVEMSFYRRFAPKLEPACKVPLAYHMSSRAGAWRFVLEDLDELGFPARTSRPHREQVDACLAWLASLHATFLGAKPDGLWKEGSYWHLATRPDEWQLMESGPLKDRAVDLDRFLCAARFRTLIHGDAKVANFCFSAGKTGARVAAVDFQYVGGGVGTKDVAYFLSSVLGESECERQAPELLDAYFRHLRDALERKQLEVDFAGLEEEWRRLYPVAWADFYRFLSGWAPGHAKMHGYSQRMTKLALAQVQS